MGCNKNSKSCGLDNIDTYILKLIVDDVLPAITHIVNLSIQQSVFPSLYKRAKVIPLLKKDDHFLEHNQVLLNVDAFERRDGDRIVEKD